MAKGALRSLVLVLVLALLGFAPAASADMPNDQLKSLRDLLSGVDELKGLDSQLAKFNPIAGGFSREVSIFGLAKITLYVYFPDGGARPPVAALALPSIALSTIIPPLKGTPMDVTLDKPVLFAAREGYLHVGKMPAGLAERARATGFTSTFHVDTGLNVFGVVAGHDDLLHQVFGLINLKAPLIAGYVSTSGKTVEDPTDKDKTRKLKDRVLSLALPADYTWREPFYFEHVAIERAAIQLRRSKERDLDPQTFIRFIGRASIGADKPKSYDLSVEKVFDKTVANSSSLAMLVAINPTGTVTLGDFLAIAGSLSNTLRLPVDWLAKGSKLPFDEIKLRNPHPANEAFPPDGGYPDFAKVMFAGANPAAKIPGGGLLTGQGPLLTVNADATVFGLDAAGLEGTISLKDGLKVDAKVKAPHLGPIQLAAAAFDTAVNMKTAYMKLHVEAATLGKFDVEADSSGLSFAVPAQCPLKPVGLAVSLKGFNLADDFSVKPQMKDCLAPVLGELVKDGEKAVKIAADIAGEAADEATGLAKTAAGEITGLAEKRTAAWGKAIANKVGAGKALNDAKAAVNGLKTAITGLDNDIQSATNWIDHALRKLWGAITGEIKKKKKQRQHLIADRDTKRTELAAAKQRQQQAEKAATDTPVPYHDDTLRQAQADELGRMLVVAQQTRFAKEAGAVPDILKSAETRKQIFDAGTIAAQAEVAFTAEHGSTIKAVVASMGSLDAATQAPVPGGEALTALAIDGKLDALREEILREEVAKLPTMAFGKRVLVQAVVQNGTLCLTAEGRSGKLGLEGCARRPEQAFGFGDTGKVAVPDVEFELVVNTGFSRQHVRFTPCLVGLDKGELGLGPCSSDARNLFFYDPLDGLIRNSERSCLLAQPALIFGACPQGESSRASWRLVDADSFNPEQAQARATLAAGPRRATIPGRSGETAETNLAPLALD